MWGGRTFKLPSGTTFESGRYVKSLGEPVAGKRGFEFPIRSDTLGQSESGAYSPYPLHSGAREARAHPPEPERAG